jgi:hypothetical protein
MHLRKLLAYAAIALAGILLLIQFVPFGRAHTNPQTVLEPDWFTPETRALAERACFDCHSNGTRWPWYASIAPASWLMQRDVDTGREHLNFSDWNQDHAEHGHASHEPEELGEIILDGSMPPSRYQLMHPDARLTDAERVLLAEGLIRTAQASPLTGEHSHEEEEHEHTEGEESHEEGSGHEDDGHHEEEGGSADE